MLADSHPADDRCRRRENSGEYIHELCVRNDDRVVLVRCHWRLEEAGCPVQINITAREAAAQDFCSTFPLVLARLRIRYSARLRR